VDERPHDAVEPGDVGVGERLVERRPVGGLVLEAPALGLSIAGLYGIFAGFGWPARRS
jgi:hypothetical protein